MSTKFYVGQKDYIPKLNEMDQAFQDAMGLITGSTTTPKPLGTAAVGIENLFARGDHVHPSTGTTQAIGNNTTQYSTTAFVQQALGSTLTKTVAGANITLTAAESLYPVVNLTGTLTANINIIVPASSRMWLVCNSSTGAFTITWKTSAGTGVAIAQGSNRFVYCDGTNVVATDTDMTGISLSGMTGNIAGNAANVTGVVAAANGGTGQSSYAIGDILFANSTTTLSKLAGVATGNALISGGVGTAPSWGKIGLATHVSGTLPVGNGGTGTATAPTQGGVIYASSASAYASTPAGTSTQVLRSNGAAAPSWATLDMTYLPDASFKKSVKAATTANITLSGTQTIDGVALVAGDRALVKNQTTASGNGIYAVAAGAWTRATDADTASEIGGGVVAVDQGTANGGKLYTTTFRTTDTLGTTNMVWNEVVDSGNIGSYISGITVSSFNTRTGAVTLTTADVTGVLGSGLPATNGGTGQTSYAVGDLLFANTTTTLSKLADVATGSVLISGGVGVAPSYGKVGLTTHVSGTLAAGNGGTGQSSYTVGDILYASSTSALSKLPAVAVGNVLLSSGVGVAPVWGKVDLTTGTGDVTGTLAVANGGTGATTAAAALTNLNGVGYTTTTGSAKIPVGTTVQRDASPAAGLLRFNSSLNQFEGHNGTTWDMVGGGARGAAGNQVFYENDNTVTGDYTITTGKNAMSAGPITINSGVTVTIPDGSSWVIV